MNWLTDKILIQVNKKSIKGFRSLYENSYSSLCSFSNKLLNNKQVAEDVVHDVFLRLWNGKTSFNSPKALMAFLYISVRNASLNELRVNKKFTDCALTDNLDFTATEEDSLQQIMIEDEYYRQLYAAINLLSPQRRKIILLSMEGIASKDIAQMLGISVNTLKTLKRKSYQFLRNKLEPINFI